jgi:beta-phosphoglucomutase
MDLVLDGLRLPSPKHAKGIAGVVFDMDGVLVDAKSWHKDAFDKALESIGLTIADADHATLFDGLPTRKKLELLTAREGLPEGIHPHLERLKQAHTIRIAAQKLTPNLEHIRVMRSLKSDGFRLGLATNSIRMTAMLFMDLAGLTKYFDSILSNEDVVEPKPSPEIYETSCRLLGLAPSEVLVFEDNDYGIQAAKAAGCRVAIVEDPSQINVNNVWGFINE